jgi:hypothetical protein
MTYMRDVTPIFGYGWVTAEGDARDVPRPFQLSCTNPNSSHGIVLNEHEFSGAEVYLLPRHTEQTGHFNIEVKRGGRLIASGYTQA